MGIISARCRRPLMIETARLSNEEDREDVK